MTQPATDDQVTEWDENLKSVRPGLTLYGQMALIARIRADGEQIAELKRDFAAYRASMNSDDDAMFDELYYRPMVGMKRRAAAAEAKLAADVERIQKLEAELAPLRAQHDAYFDIENGERIRLVQGAEAAEARAVKSEALVKDYNAMCDQLYGQVVNMVQRSDKEYDRAEAAEARAARLVAVVEIAVNRLESYHGHINDADKLLLTEARAALSAPDAQAAAETTTETEHPLKRAARISQEQKER